MKIAIAELKQESNTFAPFTGMQNFEAFHLYRGDEIANHLYGTNCELGGFVNVLGEMGWSYKPLLAAFATSGGPVDNVTYTSLTQEILDGLISESHWDGVLLSLHGAMVAEGEQDADGAFIEKVRMIVGPDIPIMVTMDLHANLTMRKIQHSTTISGFRTCPHIDLKETGIRAARMLVSTLEGNLIPKIGWKKVPMVTPASNHVDIFPGAYRDIMMANKNLNKLGAIDSSAFTVQPWMDIPELGWASLVITNDNSALADELAMKLARDMWGKRHELNTIDLIDPVTAISESLELIDGPIILTDLADGTLAGSPGDSVVVLKEMLALKPKKRCLVSVCDPEVASVASRLGVGSEIDVEIGAKLSFAFSNSIQIHAEILWVGPASFQFAQQAYEGMLAHMGVCAVLALGEIRLLVTSHPSFTTDPRFYETVGLNPRSAHIVVVKSHAGFHDGYNGISKKTVFLDTPGMSSDRIDSLDFINVDRPLFPWDKGMTFELGSGAVISRDT